MVSLKQFFTRQKGMQIMPLFHTHHRFLPSHLKTPYFIRETPSSAHLQASYTVEAAIAVPMMAMILVMVLFCFRILHVETGVDKALVEASRQTAVYAGEVEGESELLMWAKVLAKKEIKKEELPLSYVAGKLGGISLLSSDVSGDYIELVARYRIQFPFPFFYKKTISIVQTSKSRKWTGYDKERLSGEDTDYVYITPTGKAYHKQLVCTYLKLSIQKVSKGQVEKMRSKSGHIYYPCPLCSKKNTSESVYITDYGENYHYLLTCSGLKRTIYHVLKEEAVERGYHSCNKCY